MKACILSSVHPAFDTRIFYKEAKTLAQAGYEVVLIARHNKEEIVEGIRVVPLPTYASRLRRMLGSARVLRLALKERADVYHLHDPELLPAGVLLKMLTRKNVIYDAHEHYPAYILHKNWIPCPLRKPASRLFGLVEPLLVRRLDYVIYTTSLVGERYKGMRIRSEGIANYPEYEMFANMRAGEYRESKIILFLGGISRDRGILELIHAFGRVAKKGSDARLLLVGWIFPPSFKEDITSLISELGMEGNIKLVDPVPYQEARRILSEASLGVVTFLPFPNNVVGLPNKLFEYMASGLPVVASDFPLYREVVSEAGCGILVDPTSPDEIANAIETILSDKQRWLEMSQRARRAFKEQYNWNSEAKKLLQVYRELLS